MIKLQNIILSASLVIALAISPAYAYLGEKSTTDDIKQELQRLKENAKSYADDKKEQLINNIQEVYNKIGDNLNKAKGKTKEKLQKNYQEIGKNIEDLKTASKEKYQNLKIEIVVQLAELNAQIESSK